MGQGSGERKRTHVVQNHKRLGPTTLPIADGVEDTTTDDSAEELLNEESQEDTADEGQIEVVDQEEALELEGLAVAHQFPTAKDDEVVEDDKDACLLEGGHGSNSGLEPEVIGRVSHDASEDLVEYGP